jgi:hypothetical protein
LPAADPHRCHGRTTARSAAPRLTTLASPLYKFQTCVYCLHTHGGVVVMVIGLLVLASVVAIAFDDDVAAAGMLAAAVLVGVGGF